MQAKPTRIVLRAAKWVAIWSTAIGLTVTASSAAYRAYSGPALPRKQVAVLTLSHIWVTAVDGKSLWQSWDGAPRPYHRPPDPIELLPGQHKITFEFGYNPMGGHAYLNDPTLIMDIVVEAGKTYKAHRKIQYSGGKTYVSPGRITNTANIDRWWVEITEK
ncbi:MAG: hypothetical protein ABSF98_13745 [Bryobacteraceae bacterium]